MFWRSVLTSAAARSFFITQEGYYGLGNAQPGDCVFVLYGGTCPFLLRSADQSTTDRFHLVGDCYLHGVMDGEAVERWAPREREVVLV
ncbi:hypothetical protein B0H67DRAFT_500883 [Lasiosphaeris hirsuta]|uniref:Uncharacterized protein n=1 Tax=Lasiosphaeris hirsuta TaxID=260670 RepID=A0AA39ZP89_9PEZI|nr:hypothetical protein B0H67DRAFT_500883 [Lasiosphaeris hirsuta]